MPHYLMQIIEYQIIHYSIMHLLGVNNSTSNQQTSISTFQQSNSITIIPQQDSSVISDGYLPDLIR